VQKWTNAILWAIVLGVSLTSFEYRHLTMVLPFLFLVFGIYWHNYKKNKVSLINIGVVITYLLLWPPILYLMIKYV
jgi:predicted branched-subunit amino acid permease